MAGGRRVFTHDEEQFEDDDKVPLGLCLDDARRVPPVLDQIVDGQQEEDDVGRLQCQHDAVEVDELRGVEESHPLARGLVGLLQMFPPGFAQEALAGPHVRPRDLTGAEPVQQPDHQAQHQGHPLGVHRVEEQLPAARLGARHREHRAELEENVCRHGVDPEGEGREGVQGEIADTKTSGGVQGEHSTGKLEDFLFSGQIFGFIVCSRPIQI